MCLKFAALVLQDRSFNWHIHSFQQPCVMKMRLKSACAGKRPHFPFKATGRISSIGNRFDMCFFLS